MIVELILCKKCDKFLSENLTGIFCNHNDISLYCRKLLISNIVHIECPIKSKGETDERV